MSVCGELNKGSGPHAVDFRATDKNSLLDRYSMDRSCLKNSKLIPLTESEREINDGSNGISSFRH